MNDVNTITGGRANFPRPVKPQEVHEVEAGAARKLHHIPSTQLPSKEATEAELAAQLQKMGVARIINLEA